jgi:hypothetical protein
MPIWYALFTICIALNGRDIILRTIVQEVDRVRILDYIRPVIKVRYENQH